MKLPRRRKSYHAMEFQVQELRLNDPIVDDYCAMMGEAIDVLAGLEDAEE